MLCYPEQLRTQASKLGIGRVSKVPAVGKVARIVHAAFTPWELPVPTTTPLAIHFLLL